MKVFDPAVAETELPTHLLDPLITQGSAGSPDGQAWRHANQEEVHKIPNIEDMVTSNELLFDLPCSSMFSPEGTRGLSERQSVFSMNNVRNIHDGEGNADLSAMIIY